MISPLLSPYQHILTLIRLVRYAGALDSSSPGSPLDYRNPPPIPHDNIPDDGTLKPLSTRSASRRRKNSKSQAPSPSGSPPSRRPPVPNTQQADGPTSKNNRRHPASAPLSPYQQSYNRPQQPTGTRKESMGGGMQVVLGETGSWSELAKQDSTLPADAKLVEAGTKPSGMLGFLSRKKGRGHSPKPQERGILGKEGARVVISNGG